MLYLFVNINLIKNTMKIAMIGQKGIPAIFGGIEKHVEELSIELVKQGREVFVYARNWYTPANKAKHEGINIVHTWTVQTKHLDAIIHTFTATIHAMRQKPDIIHYHGVGPSILSWIPRVFAPKIKVVSTFHCIDRYHQKWGAFARFILLLGERAACLFPHKTIGVSQTIQNYCLNEFKTNIAYNPNGVNLEENPGTQCLSKFGLEKDKYLVMISRLVKHKGVHYLIPAWQKAKKEEPVLMKDLKLAIVGGSAFTDDYVKSIKKMAENDDSIIFTDWQKGDTISSLYANALMLVHPSENEGLPITVLQAMSFGRPALVSDIPEHQEVITDENFLCTTASIFSLSSKIIELLKNPELLKKTGSENLNKVKNNYHWKDIGNQTTKIYKSILDTKAEELQIA